MARPGVHVHRIRVVEQRDAWFGHRADVAADVAQGGDGALGVHETAGAESVTDALVDAVRKGDVDVALEGLDAPLADRADDIVGVGEGVAAVGHRVDRGGQLVGRDVTPVQPRDHVEVARGDIGECESGVRQLGHGQDVM